MRRWYSIGKQLSGLLLLASFCIGCSSLKLTTEAPAGFDLSGDWRLVPELSDETPDPRKIRAREDRKELRRKPVLSSQRARTGSLMFITQDFPVLLAKRMVIEQNADSMGIEYDRGAYRDVSWGRRSRELWDVYSGWEEGNLIIVSQGHDAETRETLKLEENGRLLVITVDVNADGDEVSVNRVFRRH